MKKYLGCRNPVERKFFKMLEIRGTSVGVLNDPSRLYNLDETGLNTDPKLHKLVFKRGSKEAQVILPSEGKAMYSILFTVNLQ